MSSKRPKVSVVTSVHNGGELLRPSLESVLTQRLIDFEVIAIDDGSTDDSADTLHALAQKYEQLRWQSVDHAGLTKALIRGCELARGEYIARHDSDDISLPGRLAKLATLLDSDQSLSFVSSWAQMLGPQGELLRRIQPLYGPEEATEALLFRSEGPPCHGSVMLRRNLYSRVGGYRPEFFYAQDADLWLRLGEVGRFAYQQEFLYAYRISEASISTRRRGVQGIFGKLAHECRDARLSGTTESSILKRATELARANGPPTDPWKTTYFIGRCLLSQHDSRARRYFIRLLMRRPWHIKSWVSFCQSCYRSLRG